MGCSVYLEDYFSRISFLFFFFSFYFPWPFSTKKSLCRVFQSLHHATQCILHYRSPPLCATSWLCSGKETENLCSSVCFYLRNFLVQGEDEHEEIANNCSCTTIIVLVQQLPGFEKISSNLSFFSAFWAAKNTGFSAVMADISPVRAEWRSQWSKAPILLPFGQTLGLP